MGIIITRILPEEQWRCFVAEHPAGNIFHTPEMFRVFSQAKGHQPEVWAAVEETRVLALLLPVRITLMNGLLHRLTTRAVVYGGVLCSPCAEGHQALALLLQAYVRENNGTHLFTELRNLTNLEAVQPILCQHSFAYQPHLNYLIDLNRSPEAIFESIGRRTRKNIRHGLNRGEVIIEEVKECKQVATCYGLLSQSYRAAQVPLADRSLFEAAFDQLYPRGMVRFTLARVGQAPAAVSVELLYKDVVYGWYGGMDRAYSSYVPNELLMWHILKWGAENSYRAYDFGGAGKPGETYSVRDFKSKFGGELVCYGRNIWVPNPVLLRLSELGYGFYRRLL